MRLSEESWMTPRYLAWETEKCSCHQLSWGKVTDKTDLWQKYKEFKFWTCHIPLGLVLLFLFWWDCHLNSGLHTCKVGTLLLEPNLQSILLWLFWRWGGGLMNCLLGWPWTAILQISESQVARVTGMNSSSRISVLYFLDDFIYSHGLKYHLDQI
jgi:hypothetical protein